MTPVLSVILPGIRKNNWSTFYKFLDNSLNQSFELILVSPFEPEEELLNNDNVKFIKDDSEIIAIYNKNKFKFDEIINIVKKNVEILDISTDDADLEDVFLEVTNN